MRLLAGVLAAAIAFAPVVRIARAEPTAAEIAAARELFEEGLKLEEKSDWKGALERFRKVAAVKTTPQVRFHIALCLENTGKLVDALNEFQRAQSDASVESSTSVVVTNSAKHVADLKERIPRLIVKLPDGVTGVTVMIDDAPIVATLVGTAMPLDPGPHKVSATAPKRTPFEIKVDLVERGKPITVEVLLPVESGSSAPPDDPKPPPKDETPKSSGGGYGALPYVVGAVGVAAFIGAGAMFAMRQSTISDLEEACGPDRNRCPASKVDVADKGKTYTTFGNVLIGVGAIGVVTAVVLIIVAPSGEPAKTSSSKGLQLSMGPAPTPLGLGLSAAF